MNIKVKFNEEELQDIWSALSFFLRSYPNEGATKTKAAMKKIIEKIQTKK